MKQTDNSGYLLVFAAGVLWGTIGIFVKQMEQGGSTPAETSFLRIFFAFIILLAICVVRGGWKSLLIDKKALLHCTLLGIVCQGFSNVFYAYAVTMAGVSVSAVLLNIAPICTLFFSVLLFGEKFTGRKILAIILNIVGCILTATNGHFDAAKVSMIGILYGIGAGVTYGMITIFGRLASSNADPFVTSMYSYLTGSIVLFICMMLSPQGLVSSGKIIAWGFLYAMIPTAIAYVIYFMGLAKITEPSRAPVITSVMTIVAAIIGVLLYKESLSPVGILGIVVVLASIVLINTNGQNSRS